MNLPNILTLSRVPLLFLVVVVLQSGWPWAATIALVLYGVGAVTDWLDGWVARKTGQVSDFGKLMDSLTDKIFTLGMFVTCLQFGLMPGWCLLLVLVVLSREFLVTGLRMIATTRGVVLAAERTGKIKTVFQMASIALLVLAAALSADFGMRAAFEPVQSAGVFCFCLATALTVLSGSLYFRRYGHLCGGSAEPAAPRSMA